MSLPFDLARDEPYTEARSPSNSASPHSLSLRGSATSHTDRSRAHLALIALIALLAVAAPGGARAAESLVEVDMMCPVVAVLPTADPAAPRLRLARGADQGIVVGSRGDLYAAGEQSGIRGVVARAQVVEVGPDEAVAVILPGPGTDLAAVTERAQLELRALLPVNVHRGLLVELYLTGIEFQDNARAPLVPARELLFATDDSVEKRALAGMVEAGREVVEFTHDFTARQTRTRWKGKLVAEILTNNGADDYLEFLRFVRSYPGKYIGKAWKISETYATWLINFAPPAMEDLYAELAAATPSELAARAKTLTDKELLYLLSWARRRVSDSPVSQRAQDWRMEQLLERVVGAHGPATPPMKAELAQIRARLFHTDPKKTREAVAAYREAAALYLAQGEPLDGVVCLNNAASKLADAERDDDALAQVATVLATIARERERTQSPQIASHLELEEVYPTLVAARIAKRRGRHADVIAMLTPLVDRYASTGARGARQKEMDLLDLIASAHAKLGAEDEAAAIYARIAKRAAELGDSARAVAIAFSTGDLYYDRARYPEALAAFERSAELAGAARDDRGQAKALSAAGQTLWALGKREAALDRHARAQRLREAVGDDSGIAWQLVEVSKIEVEIGDRDAARKALDHALDLRRRLGERSGEAEVHRQLGDLLLAQTRPDEAEREFTAARDLYRSLKLGPDEASALKGLASVRMKLGDASGAEALIKAAATLLERGGDRMGRLATVIWRARIRSSQGDIKGARALLEPLLPKDRAADPGVSADVLGELVDCDLQDGLLDAATAKALEASQLAEKSQDVRRRIDAISRLRTVRQTRGDLDGALALSEQALGLARSSGNRPAEVNALLQLAWIRVDLGRLAEARAAIDEALPIAKRNGDPYEVAWTLSGLSKVHQAYGDVAAELADLNEALALMTTVHFPFGQAAMIFNRALIYARLRDLDRALAEYQRAETVGGASLNSEFQVSLLSARGEALLLSGRGPAAEAALRAGIARARSEQPVMLPGLLGLLAHALSASGQHDEAVAAAQEALRLEGAMTKDGVRATATLGRVLAAAGRDAEARGALSTAIDRARRQGGALPWEAMYVLAGLEAKGGATKPAIALLQGAVHEIERGESVLDATSAARYHADKVEVFRLLVKLLLADGQVEAAFQYLERSKVAELRELDRRLGSGSDPNTALAIELDVQEKRLQRLLDNELGAASPDATKLKHLDELLAGAKRRRGEFMESLDRNDALFDRYAVRPLQLEKLQQYLGDGVLVVAPVVLDDSVVVFAMTKDVLTHFTTAIGAAEVEKLVTDFVRVMDPRGAGGVKGKATMARAKVQAGKLYDLFLRPALEAIGTPRVLVVSPTGSLRYLPFAALHDGKRWLVEETAVVNVTALDREKFAAAAPVGGPETSVLALVDPDGTLPAARNELARVQGVLANVDVFEGPDASAQTLRHKVRVPGYDVVHFATHGRLDAKNPELSNILLADVALSYADIPTLAPKKTMLVILSACQTAVLSGGSGLEIAGLAYQFQRGRVHSVLATLWEVDDAATSELMVKFYEGLQRGETYVIALAEAQRAMIAAGSGLDHPGLWAPFILMGSP